MKKKTKKKLDLSKMRISNLSEMTADKKMKAATIPPNTFWCTTTGL
ncbi:hypothetical protein SAMN05428988_5655 [Chitinophaga sp. YR573]|nr:hypothetical protein [Chitinophaga sp. YR573]SEW43912.1 hypothetical protein SAMN05428988_5655 [Chitinophaga sp. YR573]